MLPLPGSLASLVWSRTVQPPSGSAVAVRFNEVLRETGGIGERWVELYNPSDADQDLEGFIVTDDPAHLDRYAFPTEMEFSNPSHAAAMAKTFCDELLRNGTTTALVFCAVYPQSVDALFAEADARGMRLVAGYDWIYGWQPDATVQPLSPRT